MKKLLTKFFFVISVILITITAGLGLLLFALIIAYCAMTWTDQDACLDIGICKEGLELNTEHGLVLINKENCLKYNWKWDEKTRNCNVND